MTIRLFSGYSTDYIIPTTTAISTPAGTYQNIGGPTGKFFTGFSASVDFWNYKDFLAELGKSLSNGYSGNYSFTFSYDWPSNRIRLLANSGSTPYGFNFIFDQNLQQILGFNAQYISQSQITGSNAPWYIWTATNPNVTADTEIYENIAIYNEGVADSGRSYSTGKTKTVQYQDWTWGMEAQSNLFQSKGLVSNSYTYDIFIEQIRKGPYHFVKFDDIDQTIITMSYAQRDGTYELREDAYVFKPQKIFGDNDDYVFYWNVPIKTRLLSRPNQNFGDQFGNLPSTTSNPPLSGLSVWFKTSAGSAQFVSQSLLNQGWCYQYLPDWSGLNNNTDVQTNSFVKLAQTSSLGACFGQYLSGATGFNPQIALRGTASLASLTASGITFAFPFFINISGGYLDYQTIFSATFPTTNTGLQLNLRNAQNYYGDFSSPLYLTLQNVVNTNTFSGIQTSFTASKEHFCIMTYDNATSNLLAWIDGSQICSIYGTQSVTGVISQGGAYQSLDVSTPMQYSIWTDYTSTFGTNISQSYIPEMLIWNRPISSSSEINQINNYFGTKYPTIKYSLN